MSMRPKWTPEQISKIQEMKARGHTLSQIADEMRTSVGSIAGLIFRIKHPALFETRPYAPRTRMDPEKRAKVDAAIRNPEYASTGSAQLARILGVTKYYIRGARRDAGIVMERKKSNSRRSRSKPKSTWSGWGTQKGSTQRHRSEAKKYGTWEAAFDGSKTLLEVDYDSCMWPLGEFDSIAKHYCGSPRQEDKPYCARHCSVAYLPSDTDIVHWGAIVR